jgi:hypothetical protein
MPQTRRVVPILTAAVVLMLAAAPARAQKAEQTATQFYMTYRAAFDKAKRIEDVLPYMSKKTRGQVESTPAAERPKMFEIVKMMGTLTNVKVSKETKTADGVTLTVSALDSDKKPTSGQIEIVKEDGAWKLGGESWSSKS